MIHYATVDETTWPVDLHSDDEDSAQWVLRYGTTERREAQRLSVASVVSAYASMTDPERTLKDAVAMLRRARIASSRAITDADLDGVAEEEAP